MILIPVIDLAAGRVVHARGGERAAYPPLQSRLSRSSDPHDVLAGLLALFPFPLLYVADLDAIVGTGDQARLIADLQAAHPGLRFWVDAGLRDLDGYRRQRERYPGTPVVGSETLADPALLDAPALRAQVVLSLDFRGDRLLGATAVLDRPERWPARVICMSLDRIGAGTGPDLARLRQLARAAPTCELFAAGGVAGGADLAALARAGAAGALVASALHDGRIDAAALHGFAR